MAKVYWIKSRSSNLYGSITAKIHALLGIPELAEVVVPNHSLAIKINVSELGYAHSLAPIAVTTLFEQARAREAKALVTDSGSLFRGSRFSGHDWMNTALVQGFSIGEAFDNQMMLAGGFTNEEGRFCSSDGEHLGGVELGSLVTDITNLVVLSHVTAHPVVGMAGALYNLGMGMLTRSGKARVHSCLELEFDESKCDGSKVCLSSCPTGAVADAGPRVSFDPRMCNGCLGCFMSCPKRAMSIKAEGKIIFQESVVEAAQVLTENLRGNAFYVNFLSSVTPQSDDYAFSDVPFVPDLGILASADPVALDWATYQMIVQSPGAPGSIAEDLGVAASGDDKFQAIIGCSPAHLLEHAERLKLGSRECEFLVSA